jgi:hypothetical protein
MTKTNGGGHASRFEFASLDFEFVSDFVLRASDFIKRNGRPV